MVVVVVVVVVSAVLVTEARNCGAPVLHEIEPAQGDLAVLDGLDPAFGWKEPACPAVKRGELVRRGEVGAARQQHISCLDLVSDLVALEVFFETRRIEQTDHGSNINRLTDTRTIQRIKDTR